MGQNMTTQLLIEKVGEQIGPLHSQSDQAVAAAMKILRDAQTEPPAQPTDEKFSGRNITLEEYKALPREEKSRYHDEAEELNWRWVEKQLNSLQAKWIMVVDGQVVSHGATLKNFPGREDIVKICERTGKYPFVFFSPRIFAIEELSNPWHTTKDAGDAYPAFICVNDWRNGPFIAINPARTFLLGRSVLLELQPRLVLDFAARRTEVQFVEAAN
jgi:hypothetical protein